MMLPNLQYAAGSDFNQIVNHVDWVTSWFNKVLLWSISLNQLLDTHVHKFLRYTYTYSMAWLGMVLMLLSN